MASPLARIGKLALALIVLNEIRGLIMVALFLSGWVR